ncbi:MAG: hypothetical protein OEX77_07040 [Candidatus Bathyarchaeota archaeon]|nr:hypothetical protein [Candidatus Bathyarchaeota archaeon]MDH5733640.1 hypothetical protein [Candidatus Bathyarchaeota archaeon]
MLRKATFGIVVALMVAGMLTLTFSARAIDATPPIIDIILPQSYPKYYINPVPLNFTIDEPTSWIGYSVDDQENETITGNTTITEVLALGLHNIMIYANDSVGNMGLSATIYFNVTFNTDVTLDGQVRIDDVLLAVKAFGADPYHSRWNECPQADVNGDEVVRVDDILAVALDFGKTL